MVSISFIPFLWIQSCSVQYLQVGRLVSSTSRIKAWMSNWKDETVVESSSDLYYKCPHHSGVKISGIILSYFMSSPRVYTEPEWSHGSCISSHNDKKVLLQGSSSEEPPRHAWYKDEHSFSTMFYVFGFSCLEKSIAACCTAEGNGSRLFNSTLE